MADEDESSDEFSMLWASTHVGPNIMVPGGMLIKVPKTYKPCSYCGRYHDLDKHGNCESCGAPY